MVLKTIGVRTYTNKILAIKFAEVDDSGIITVECGINGLLQMVQGMARQLIHHVS